MLYLHKLTLDGFLSYDHAEIQLDQPGITNIHGATGAGKSAIFEAILYLLFGATLRKRASVAKLINLVLNRGYDIKLDFNVDGVPMSIREVRDRPDADLYFVVNGEDKRGKTSPETRKNILAALKLSVDDFKNIAFLGQRQNMLLISGTNSERAQILTEIFGLDIYNEYVAKCDKDLKEAMQEQKTTTGLLQQATLDLGSLQKNFETLNIITPIDNSVLIPVNEKIVELEGRIAKIRELDSSAKSTLDKAKSDEVKRKNIQVDLARLEEELTSIVFTESSLTIEDVAGAIEREQGAKTEVSLCIKNSTKEIEEIYRLSGCCPITKKTCPVGVPEQYKGPRLDELKSTIQIYRRNDNKLSVMLDELKNKKDKLEEKTLLEKELDQKRMFLDALADTQDVSQEEQLHEKCLAGVSKANEKLEVLRDEKIKLTSKIALYKQQVDFEQRCQGAIAGKQQAIELAKQQLEELSITIQYLSAAISVFKKCKTYKIDLVLELLNETLTDILNKVTDGELTAKIVSQKKDSTGKKTLDALDIVVTDKHKSIPIELSSGGQEQLVGIGILLSLWKVAHDLSEKSCNVLFLDEIFGPLNSAMVNSVFESVVELTKRFGAQSTYVISHKELNDNLFDHVLNVTLVDGISQLSLE